MASQFPVNFSQQLFAFPCIQQEHELGAFLRLYQQQLQASQPPNSTLLQRAEEKVCVSLQGGLHAEIVHLALFLYQYQKTYEKAIPLLTTYLAQPLPLEEEAWARWHLIDHLALTKQDAATIAAQESLLLWAKRYASPGALLWAWMDSTQASCWRRAGRGEAWLQIARDLLAQATPIPDNCHERYTLLVTATDVARSENHSAEAISFIEQLRRLTHEISDAEARFQMTHEVSLLGIKVFLHQHDIEQARQEAMKLSQLLAVREREAVVPAQNFWPLYHNLGAVMYFAGQYDLAIPWLRRALEHSTSEHTYLWLAAALWATTEQREVVLPLLTKGAAFATGGQAWLAFQALPEFRTVHNDAGFLSACGAITKGLR
jgi:tetratricopeptide (TPR) repeat protein